LVNNMSNTCAEILMLDVAIKWCSYCTKIRLLMSNFQNWQLHFQHSESFNQLVYYFVKRIQTWQKQVATHFFERTMEKKGSDFFGYGFKNIDCPLELHLVLIDHASSMLQGCYESDNVGISTKKKIKTWFRDILSKNIEILGEQCPEVAEYDSIKKYIEMHSTYGHSHGRRSSNDNGKVIEYTFFNPHDLFSYIAHVVKHRFGNVHPPVKTFDTWCQCSGQMIEKMDNYISGLDNYNAFLNGNNLTTEQVEWRSFPDLFLLTRALVRKDMSTCRSEICWDPIEKERVDQSMDFFEDFHNSLSSIERKTRKAETTSFSERRKLHGGDHVHAPDQTLPQCENDMFLTGTKTLYLALPTKHGESFNVYFGNGRNNGRNKRKRKLHPWETPQQAVPRDHSSDNESGMN